MKMVSGLMAFAMASVITDCPDAALVRRATAGMTPLLRGTVGVAAHFAMLFLLGCWILVGASVLLAIFGVTGMLLATLFG